MIGLRKANTQSNTQNCFDGDSQLLNVQSRIDLLHVQTRRHLWELLLFLLVSMAALALREINLHENFTEGVRQLLGYPLPAELLSIALSAYGFSTLTLLLTRREAETRTVKRWFHFSFRTVFYLFYCFSGALAGHYLFVFILGLFLYISEQLSTWLSLSRVEAQDGELVEEP